MQIRNIHEREFDLPMADVGALIDTLASKRDRLWPHDKWPPMRFDRALGVGALGGHGPIRYTVEEYRPGRFVQFRFLAPRGFKGVHRFEVEKWHGRTVLRHVLEMRPSGLAKLRWLLVIRPLHDALLEDCMDRASAALGVPVENLARWSTTVKVLRAILRALTGNSAR